MEAIKKSVAGGMGVSIISEAAVDWHRDEQDYMVFDIDGYDFNREFYLVYNSKVTMSPTVETFKYFVLKHFGYPEED